MENTVLIYFHLMIRFVSGYVCFAIFFLSSRDNSVPLYVHLQDLGRKKKKSLGIYTKYQIRFGARRLHARYFTASAFGSASKTESDPSMESEAWIEILILLLASHRSCLNPELQFLHL